MTNRERKLHDAAEMYWHGSGYYIVALSRVFRWRLGDDLWLAAMISTILMDVPHRAEVLATIRSRLPESVRRGPRADKIAPAKAAIDALEAMIDDSQAVGHD